MVTTRKRISAEELRQMPEPVDGSRYERFQRELIKIPPAGGGHGQCCALIARARTNCLEGHRLGHVVSNDTGVLTRRDPDTVLAPDLGCWSRQRLPEVPEGFIEVPPDPAVEAVSPTDPRSYVHRKVAPTGKTG